MLLALPYHRGDSALALANLRWIEEIGAGKNHDILLVPDNNIDTTEHQAVAKRAFKSVKVNAIQSEKVPWPFSQNHAWKCTVDYIVHFNLGPFFYLESDAIVLCADGFDRLEAEYLSCGEQFMGYLEWAGTDSAHMNGVAFYGDIIKYAPSLLTAPTPQDVKDIGQNHMAFDMAGAREVLHHMHRTDLIQFQYKKETQLIQDESLSWLNPDAVLFHTCKLVEIFDLLRKKISRGLSNGQTTQPGGDGANPSEFAGSRSVKKHPESPGAEEKKPASPTVDVFVKTYPADAMWHEKCKASYDKFCTGFRSFVEVNDDIQPGYLVQQISKLSADKHSDADYFLVNDSDTLFISLITPENFFRNGKSVWFYDDKDAVLAQDKGTAKWFKVMKEAIGQEPKHEFMRRQPFMVPRWLLQSFRAFMEQRHSCDVDSYILSKPEFSEWNVLGFYAYTYHQDRFEWLHNSQSTMVVRQFWSAHHFTPEKRRQQFEEALPEINVILSDSPATKALPAPRMLALSVTKNETTEETRKRLNKERMAKVRAGRGKRKKVAA